MVQRVVSGVVLRETDPAQSPLRRMNGSVFGSIMIAIIALAVTGVIGVIFPGGNTSWQEGGRVIIESESGAQFVWLADENGDFFLHPVTNFASAALLVGTVATVDVSRNSLLGAPRGSRLGIIDAPDSLPDPGRILGSPWTLCSLPAETVSGEEVPNTALVVGRARSRGAVVGEAAVLVRDTEQGSLHLVWNGHQYPIPVEDPVLEGLTLRQEPQIRVGTAWLSALPAGEPIRAVTVAGRGGASTAFGGAVIGEIRYVASAESRQNYLVAANGIVEITEVQAQIQLADPLIRDSVYGGQPPEARPLTAAEANDADRVALPAARPSDPPARQPAMAVVSSERSTICGSFTDAGALPEIAVEAAVEGAEVAPATPSRTQDGTVLANRVLVEPGWGTVVDSRTSSRSEQGALYLVTDEGRRYALPTRDEMDTLGYSGVAVVPMPASLVARIPSGEALDPDAARSAS